MFVALLAKEWRQLRLLRRLCLGLGVAVVLMLPPLVAWRSGYNALDAFADLMPRLLAWGLWPLAALLASVQAFTADRTQGTETFLLERPVPRRRAWAVRLLASAATTLSVVLCTVAVWLLLGPLHGLEGSDYADALEIMVLHGAPATVLALLGGMLAATFVASPLTALLLGLVLGSLPAVLAAYLVEQFPHATISRVQVVFVMAALLACAYPVVSWAALCRGEPGGRGRQWRGGLTFAAALVLLVLAFLVTASLAVRLGARTRHLDFSAPAEGRYTLALESGRPSGGRSAWLVDLETARVTRFLPPPVLDSAWSPDGRRVAVATRSAPFGGESGRDRVLILDGEGREAGPTKTMGDGQQAVGIGWVRDGILLIVLVEEADLYDLVVLDPGTGGVCPLKQGLRHDECDIAGPTGDGKLFLSLAEPCGRVAGVACARGESAFGLYALDLGACRVGEEPLLRGEGHPGSARRRLSPDGRYWVSGGDRGRADEPLVVRDLETGDEHVLSGPLPVDEAAGVWGNAGSAMWVTAERLFWLERTAEGRRRILSAAPGDDPAVDWEWDGAAWHISRYRSPDRSTLLVKRREGKESSWFLQDPVTGERRELETGCCATWAGPRTLAHRGGHGGWPEGIALEDLDRPGDLRWLFGGP